MDNQEATVRRIKEDFLRRWGEQFPTTPPPPIRALSSLHENADGDNANAKGSSSGGGGGGVSFDEWLASGVVEQLRKSYRLTEEKISQLEDQLARKIALRDFLAQLLDCLEGKGDETLRPRPRPAVDRATSDVTTPNTWKVRGESGAAHSTTQVDSSATDGVKGHSSPAERFKGHESTPAGPAIVTQAIKQTTFSPAGTNLEPGVTSHSRHGECAGCVTKKTLTLKPYTGNCENTAITSTLKDQRVASTCEYSTQRDAIPGSTLTSEKGEGGGVSVAAVQTATCATQTDITSAHVSARCLGTNPPQSTDASTNTTAMFWNRSNKKSNQKRADEVSGRDNSDILGKHSQTGDTLPVRPAPKVGSDFASRNFQYLTLTDGFNLALQGTASSSNPSPLPQRREEQKGEDVVDVPGVQTQDSDDEEVYHNNTTTHPSRSHWYAVSSRGGWEMSEDEKVEKNAQAVQLGASESHGFTTRSGSSDKSQVFVTKFTSHSSLATPRRAHTPLLRVSSDLTGARSASFERASPSAGETPLKPQPHPRRKPPPLPDKQKPPPSMLYGETRAAQRNPAYAVQHNASSGGRGIGEERQGVAEEGDKTPGTCVESGRGIRDTVTPGVLHREKHTPAQRPADASGDEGGGSGRGGGIEEGGAETDITTKSTHSVDTSQRAGESVVHSTASASRRMRAQREYWEIHLPDSPETKSSTVEPTFSQRERDIWSRTGPKQGPSNDTVSSQTNTKPDSAVRELCGTSVPTSSGINPYLAHTNSDDPAGSGAGSAGAGGSGVGDAEMLRFNRHNLSARAGSDVEETPAVYRKTDEALLHRDSESTKTLTDMSQFDDNTKSQEGKHNYTETDIDAVDRQPVMRRDSTQQAPSVLAKPRKRQRERTNSYENWTINRALTQQEMYSTSEDDDSSNSDNGSSSPGGTLDRLSTKGSKDSGLCLDPPSSSSDVPAATKGDGLLEGGGKDFKRSMDELLQQYQAPEDEDYSYIHPSDGHNDDSGSIASDIVFFHGSDVTGKPHTDGGRQGLSSEDDEERYSPSGSHDTSYDETDGVSQSPSPREKMLNMRHLLIKGVLETERTYLAILELLLHYKRTLEASCKTSQPVISEEKINAIFGNLQEVYQIHSEFVNGLQEKVRNWTPEQTIGDVFKCLVVMFPKFGEYAQNYQTAVAAIHECSAGNSRFQELAQQIVLTSTTREVTSLEDALFKPVQRLQRNTLVLHDLIKHTPEDHPDYQALQKALSLSQHNLENFGTAVGVGNKVEEKRHLVKSSFLVELVSGWRKLRFIFLFSDVLVCTKREQHRGGKVSFDCKWFIPMNALKMDTKFSYQDDMKFSKKDDINDLKRKLRSLKTELKAELKKDEQKDKHWSITGMASSRTIDKLQKKINELEAQLIMSSPKLPFKVWLDTGKTHTLLMTTDYEREEWRETITGLRRMSASVRSDQPTVSVYDVQEMVNSVRELPQVNKIGTVLIQKDDEAIYGTLNITIHKMNGLSSPCDTYCCLEMDSYGHFFMKARTHICENSADPSWNEDFELELEGSQTLRILCYRNGPDKQGDILLGRGALEMSKEWLRSSFQERTVAMNDYSLVISVRYTAADKTMRRTPSKQSAAVFGVRIAACARREGKTVPTIVTACVQEVEKRGMDETGIYRVSGVTSDVQRLKKLFDKSVKVGAASLGDVDIHSVTGVLKLYLRELPEPLFTDANYINFVDALKLSDEEAKEKCMLNLLHSLPDTSYYTIVYLLEHLVKVSKCVNDNKMTIHNISTIFGPTLLAPAAKETQVSPLEMMSMGAEHAMRQSAIIDYFLTLIVYGCSLRRSAQN